MKYDYKAVEAKWQKVWEDEKTFHVEIDHKKPKFYALVEFPYPSGAGLHVGHPRSYTALDVVSRKRRKNGYNVLYPMGWDAFGLPTENFAMKNHIHPAIVTKKNVDHFREQLKALGFSFDWDREINTTDPEYYKWTQWIFLQLYKHGLAYKKEMNVNWCTGCKCVLANEEVVNGVCERCGSEVVHKVKSQWMLKITAYADKLIDGLDGLDYIERVATQQKNWIGRSHGAEVNFGTTAGDTLTVYTTRCDTLFGATYMVVSPEHAMVKEWLDKGILKNADAVKAYQAEAARKSDFERSELNKEKTGVFTGSYAINPMNGAKLPIWLSDYVLADYGTGAIMAVPAHDSRDYAFAKHFGLEIRPLIEGCDVSEESFDAKEGIVCNSPKSGVEAIHGFSLNGLSVKEAIQKTKEFVKANNLGRVKVNYRLRDAIFSRQRYWGEPFPVYYKDGEPYMIPEECLPLELPEIDQYKPTETGEPPLGHAKKWAWDTTNNCVVDKSLVDNVTVFPLELNTMPGFAGSSAYYLRYMDPTNDKSLVSHEADQYWRNVDLYVGGTEHATGHLIYSRYWNKFLHDIGVSCEEEPFKKLVNQGMIQGRSNFVYRVNSDDHDAAPVFVSLGLKDKYDTTPIHVDVNIVHADVLDINAFKAWRPEYENAEFILEDGRYICGWAVEKMSKSMYNVVNPDDIVERYGADTLRLYEMFLGPVEQSKPWDTNGIDGCHRFLKKFWGLYSDKDGMKELADGEATAEELKSVHKLIKKVTQDIEAFSYNTSVAAFMICVNELSQMKCRNRALLTDMVVLIAPFAPHIAEELWHALGNDTTVFDAAWPEYNEKFLVESTVSLTVSFNGKARYQMQFAADADNKTIEDTVLADDRSKKYIGDKNVVKVIIVPKKIVNIVIK